MINARTASIIRTSVDDMRSEREELIAFHRGSTIIEPQPFRVELSGSRPVRKDSESSDEHRVDAVIVGKTQADVLIDDRFVLYGTLYRVIVVHPNRQIMTQVDCEMVDGPETTLEMWIDEYGVVMTDELGRPFVFA